MLWVMALEANGVRPESGEILVTGAAGGVGSIAVALLAQLGYQITALSGRPETADYLKGLGASNVIGRDEVTGSKRPLDSERWAGAVDVVGGEVLAGLLKGMAYGSTVAACGLAGSHELPTTVFPFILRGVSLVGIDSVMCPYEKRLEAWKRLGELLPKELLESAAGSTISLDEVPATCADLVAGKVRGRVVVGTES